MVDLRGVLAGAFLLVVGAAFAQVVNRGGGTFAPAAANPPLYPGAGTLTPDQYGANPANADNSTQLNNWIAACIAQSVICYAPTPTSGPYVASTITVPGPVLIQGSGNLFTPGGVFNPVFRQKSGTNANFITIAAGTGSPPIFKDLAIDGNKTNNSSGHTIYLPDDGNGGEYGWSIDLQSVYITNCAQDCIYAGVNRNAGEISNSFIMHGVNNGLTLNSPDWRVSMTQLGSHANYGIHCPTNCSNAQFHGGAIFSNLIGFVATAAGYDPPAEFHGVSIDHNLRNGVSINSGGNCTPYTFIGGRFIDNSASGTGTYSDILLTNTCGTIVSSVAFGTGQITKSKYLIEAQSMTGPAYVVANSYDWANAGTRPYTTASTNDFVNVPLSH